MKPELTRQLLALNTQFYRDAATDFAATREKIWPGLSRVRQLLAEHEVSCQHILDAGCGNGRLLPFAIETFAPVCYVGIDASTELLVYARVRAAALQQPNLDIRFFQADLTDPAWTARLGDPKPFHAIFCLATLHHMPTRALRSGIMTNLAHILDKDGVLILSNWQPHHSPRQRRKMVDWSALQVSPAEVEAGDCLIAWKRGVRRLRYVHILDRAEVVQLATRAGLQTLAQFEADGAEGNLNLYSILCKT